MNPFTLKRLDPHSVRPAFDCGEKDLNDFYFNDSKVGGNELTSVTYLVESDGGDVVGFFSVSNDAIKKEIINSRSILKRLLSLIPREKRYSSLPAVKIGRLGVSKDFQGKGYGRDILDYIKVWFTHDNKTGCRFVVVDAYNQERVLNFYSKNGFDFLLGDDKDDDTRLMYFDLITFRDN